MQEVPPNMKPSSVPAATATPTRPDRLLFFTSISALDGTIATLAATGVLATLSGAIVAGLTVIAGAGAWLTAHQTYAHRPLTRKDRTGLSLLVLFASLATLIAATLGHSLSTLEPTLLPKAAGIALLLVALELTGIRLPRRGPLSLPLALITTALALEVLIHWTQ